MPSGRRSTAWNKTNLRLTWLKDLTDVVYMKSFDAGTVDIPGHDGKAAPYLGVLHAAFVKGANVAIFSTEN